MNLQHCSAAGPRIRLELAAAVEHYTEMSVRSFDTFFLWHEQLDAQSIQDDVCSWRWLMLDAGEARARTPREEREAVPGFRDSSQKTSGNRPTPRAADAPGSPHAVDNAYVAYWQPHAVDEAYIFQNLHV